MKKPLLEKYDLKKLLPLFLFAFSFISCAFNDNSSDNFTVIDCPAEIAARAFRFSELYKDSETVYGLGGQSPVRSAISIDCSGLVIMCYKYAMVDTRYSLLVSDMTAAYMYKNASSSVTLDKMRQGDLIFMGEANSSAVSHISIFDCVENGNIYFIDSTEKGDINGVARRYYAVDDSRFKAFGIMKIQY